MGKILYAIAKTARPRQWLKNLAIFTTVLFTGHFFDLYILEKTLAGFFSYCLLSSSNYYFNDILDASSDRKHPFKKNRPIASGILPVRIGWFISLLFLTLGLIIAYTIGSSFFLLAVIFILLQYTYTLFLKKIALIDILAITAGYIIRVYAGEAATGYHISVWLALAALSLALFLAVGKRRSELTLLQKFRGVGPKDTRQTLSHYSEKLLDTYTAMFANSTFITYSFFSFLERPIKTGFFFQGYSSYTDDVTSRKWLMITIPFVMYGIMRYMKLIYEGQGESPEKILTSDLPLLSTVLIWMLTVFTVVYGIGG